MRCSLAVRSAALALIAACSNEPGGGGAGMSGGDPAVSFERSVLPIVEEACNCHRTEPFLMAPFSLKSGEAFDNLISLRSTQATMALVAPGALNESYLWHKLNGTQLEVGGSGLIMPSTIPLDEEDLHVFERWIVAGAPR